MNLTKVCPTSVIMFQNCAAFFLHSCVFTQGDYYVILMY